MQMLPEERSTASTNKTRCFAERRGCCPENAILNEGNRAHLEMHSVPTYLYFGMEMLSGVGPAALPFQMPRGARMVCAAGASASGMAFSFLGVIALCFPQFFYESGAHVIYSRCRTVMEPAGRVATGSHVCCV